MDIGQQVLGSAPTKHTCGDQDKVKELSHLREDTSSTLPIRQQFSSYFMKKTNFKLQSIKNAHMYS